MLVNGETAVSVQRGERANTPWVVSIVDKVGMPIVTYTAKNTSDAAYAIQAPLNFEAVRVVVNADKVRRARDRIPR